MENISRNQKTTILSPGSISVEIIQEIQNLLQDMWATSLGEMTICQSCQNISSKQDVFGSLPKELYKQKIVDILNIKGIENIECPKCSGNTEFIYGGKHARELQEKITKSVYSYIKIAHDKENSLHGIGMYYVDSLENIYEKEFAWHYEKIGIENIRKNIDQILTQKNDFLICFAAIGFQEGYGNPFAFFDFFQGLFRNIPDKYREIPGIMEVDKNNATYKIFTKIGATSLQLEEKYLQNTGKNYESRLLLFQKPVEIFEKIFSGGLREYIQKIR